MSADPRLKLVKRGLLNERTTTCSTIECHRTLEAPMICTENGLAISAKVAEINCGNFFLQTTLMTKTLVVSKFVETYR